MTPQGNVANLRELTDLFNKKLLPKARIKPTDTFESAYKKVVEALGFLQDIYIGFESLNRPDLDNILTETFWKVWDRV